MKESAGYQIVIFLFIAISTCWVDILIPFILCNILLSSLHTHTPQNIFYGVVDVVPFNFLHET